jgi:hypothetical protein
MGIAGCVPLRRVQHIQLPPQKKNPPKYLTHWRELLGMHANNIGITPKISGIALPIL